MQINKDTLFMRYPSTWWHGLWMEGLPSGNGEIGINVHGGVKEEITMIQHHNLWHAGKEGILPDVSKAFIQQRKMMDEEDFKNASWEVVNELRKRNYDSELESQLPLAGVVVQIKPNEGFNNYIRGIHMDTGEVGCEWLDGISQRSSYSFVSRTRNIVVKRIKASQKDLKLLFNIDMYKNDGSENAEKYAKYVIETKETKIEKPYIYYTAQDEEGKLYGTVAKIIKKDGSLENTPIGVKVIDSSDVMLIIKSFVKERVERKKVILQELKEEIDKIDISYEKLLAEHKQEHQKWYNSAEFSLNYGDSYHYNEDLLAMAYSGKQPLELIEKMWRYGRYLFICGTSPKSNPFPMYGLWGGDYKLPWSHNMANENIQMIYWHTYAGNLLPFQEGIYKYYNDRISIYQNNAKKIYGMKGIYIPAGTTPGVSALNQVVPVIVSWVSAAGWLAQHYCDYYWFTKDTKYLEEIIIPYLKEVADFYEDFIEFYPNGKIHFYPSVSPENTPQNFMPPEHIQMPHPMPTTVNSTIDLAIVKEFFKNIYAIAKEQDIFSERYKLWEKIIDSIPDYMINEQGGIKEWQDDRFKERYAHRHLSHIYPVFPGKEVNKLHYKELLAAFRRAVDLREIDAQTSWSLAHMSAIYARFEDGEAAMKCLNNIAKSALTNNFFTFHNDWRKMNISLNTDCPIQLDAVMGYVNALQEMVIYVSQDLVKFLPALPSELYCGEVKSFRYTNGFVDMSWNKLEKKANIILKSVRKHEMYIQLPQFLEEYNFECKNCIISKEKELYKIDMEATGYLMIKGV